MTTSRIPIDGAHSQELTSNAETFYKNYWTGDGSISEESLKRHKETIAQAFSAEPENLKIAELGVGAEGGVLLLLKEKNEVFGFDVSETAVKVCNDKGIPCQTYNGDTQKLPLGDSSLDALFACEVFEHFANPQHALEEVSRVLKPGGMCVFTIPNQLIHHWPRLFYPALMEKVPFREFLMINRFKIRKEVGIGNTVYKAALPAGEDSWSWLWVCENVKNNDAESLFLLGKYFIEKKNALGIRTGAIEASDLFRSAWQLNEDYIEAAFALAFSLVYRVINGEKKEFQTLLNLIFEHMNNPDSPNREMAEKYFRLTQSELARYRVGLLND